MRKAAQDLTCSWSWGRTAAGKDWIQKHSHRSKQGSLGLWQFSPAVRLTVWHLEDVIHLFLFFFSFFRLSIKPLVNTHSLPGSLQGNGGKWERSLTSIPVSKPTGREWEVGYKEMSRVYSCFNLLSTCCRTYNSSQDGGFLILQMKKQAAIKFCLKYSGGICLFSYCCIKKHTKV